MASYRHQLHQDPLKNIAADLGEALPENPENPQALPRSEPPLEIVALLWNINGKEAKPRKVLVPEVTRKVNPDVILLQETTTDILVERIKSQGYKEIRAIEKKQTRILFNTTRYNRVPEGYLFQKNPPMTLQNAFETSINTMVPAGEQMRTRSGQVGWQQKLKNHMSIVGLRREGYDKIVVFLSHHHPHTGLSDDRKRTSSEQFCNIVSEISRLTGCTVLAGADMNFTLPTGDHNGVTVFDYEETERRQGRKIDFFIIAPQGAGRGAEASALKFFNTEEHDMLHPVMRNNREYTIDQYMRALDHDPLLLVLTLGEDVAEENVPED